MTKLRYLASFLFCLFIVFTFSLTRAQAQNNFRQWDDEPNELSWEHFSTCRFCFEDFKNWWAKLPAERRQNVIDAAQKAGMLKAAPGTGTSLWIQGEAFKGDKWTVNTIGGRTALKGPYGHTGPTAKMILDVPQAGIYHLWSRWWNIPGYHNSFRVRIRPDATKAFQYSWQETAEGDYLDHRFAFAWYKRPTPMSVSYDADKYGFQWESTPLFHLPKGQVVLEMMPTIHDGPYTSRNIDCFLLTQDPFLNPDGKDIPDSKPNDPASLVITQEQSSAGNNTNWQLWNIRPAAMSLNLAPAPLAKLWRDWRDQLIERLAKGEGNTPHEKILEHEFYFDDQWNLIGTPAQVAAEAATLATSGGKVLLPTKSDPPVAWFGDNEDQWTGFAMTDQPKNMSQVTDSSPVKITMQPGAVASRVLHLTNSSDKPITLTPTITAGENLLSWRLVAYQFQPAYGWQPMPLLKRHQITIPAHLTASIWLTFDARDLLPGLQTATLNLETQQVTFQINVAGIDIRNAKAPLVGGWCAPWPTPEGWRTFADIGLNIVHGKVLSKADMEKYHIALFDVMLGIPKSADQVRGIVNTMKSMGLDYNDWAWEISDEPNQRTYKTWIDAAKIIRQADPKIRIWCNPGDIKSSTPEAVTAMSPWIDIFCPYVNHFVSNDAEYQKLLMRIGNPKLLYTTPCSKEKAPNAPLDYFNLADASLKYNRDGWDAFSLRAYYPYAATAWDEMNTPYSAQAVSIYPGARNQVIGSRNLEAVRQAIQKWETAKVLSSETRH